MSSLFPLRSPVDRGDREPRLVELDDETADEVFEALAAGTTRQVFLELHRSPQTASDLASVTDTSVQNAQYHLEKLQDADLVEVVDTWYSERGSEMKVYAPRDESLVLFAGQDKPGTLRTLLERIVGVIALLLPASAVVGLVARRLQPTTGSGDAMTEESAAGDDAAIAGDTQEAVEPTVETVTTLDPTVATGLFLLGGLFVLAVATGWWYYQLSS